MFYIENTGNEIGNRNDLDHHNKITKSKKPVTFVTENKILPHSQFINQEGDEATPYIENQNLKNLYLERLKNKDHKRHFQVFYIFKNKIKRMYRIDCMTRKINV